MLRAGVGQDNVPVLLRRGCDLLEAVIGALFWDVRGFGDNGQRMERDQVSGFKKLLSGFGEPTATSAASTAGSAASFAASHLHLTPHLLCVAAASFSRLVEFFGWSRVHTFTQQSGGFDPLGLGSALRCRHVRQPVSTSKSASFI